jgi:hypothetical protein
MILEKVSLFWDFSIKKRNARSVDTSGGELISEMANCQRECLHSRYFSKYVKASTHVLIISFLVQ